MSKLLVEEKEGYGQTINITPEKAGWEYVGFDVYRLKTGEVISDKTNNNEVCLVVLSGKVNVKTSEENFTNVGERMSVFEKIPPYSVYIPNDDEFTVEATTEVEIAICLAPGHGTYGARLIKPDDIKQSIRGEGNMTRQIHDILPENKNADSLLVVEVFTPEGNTSSYPPHKHDQNNLPNESYLEETYYHKINPEQGYAFQRVYNDNRSLDETIAVKNNSVVLVPEGYHPFTSLPGYDCYYLNVMAGPERAWKFNNEKEHEWLFTGM